MPKPTGYVIYRGPSVLDGAPIVVIATVASENRKTGPMVQTWILRADMAPTVASKAGADESICGQCPQRWHLGGACYVNIGQGPQSVYGAWQRGRYPDAPRVRDIGDGRKVRLGAYGDPAAVPVVVWHELIHYSAGHTGYTHQWRTAPELRDLCMASVDSAAEYAEAQLAGWRTFRVTGTAELLEPSEILCPSEASGRKCAECLACDGANASKGNAGASVAITVHGSLASRFKVVSVAA